MAESVGKKNGIWINLDRPLRERPPANLLHCKPHIAKESCVSCCVVDAASHWGILEVLCPNRTFGPIADPASSLSCKHIELVASENSNAPICADLCPEDCSLVRRESYHRKAIERWCTPFPRCSRTEAVACPRSFVRIVGMSAWLATSHACSPILVFAVALLGGICATHRLLTILPKLAAVCLHPVCHILARMFCRRHARSATAQWNAAPYIRVRILQEGSVSALWHAHCPPSCLLKTLVPWIFAALCMKAVLALRGTPLLHPWSFLSSSVRAWGAHPNRCAIPSLVICIDGIGTTRHTSFFATVPLLVLFETLHPGIFATPLLSAVLRFGCTLLLYPRSWLCTIVGRWCRPWCFWAQGGAVPWQRVTVSWVGALRAPGSAPCPSLVLLETLETLGFAASSA